MDLGEKCQTRPQPKKASTVTEAYMAESGRTHVTVSWRVIRYNPQSVYQKRRLTRVTRSSGNGGPGLPVFPSLAPRALEKTDGQSPSQSTHGVSLSTQANTPRQRFLSTGKPEFKEMSVPVQGLLLGQFQAYGL